MKAFKTYTGILFFVMSSAGFAQNVVDETRSLDLIEEIGPQNIVTTLDINPAQIGNIPNHPNNIYIDQIGTNNSIRLKSITETSNIDVIQNGNNNVAKLNFSALSAVETFHQLGNNHHLAAYGKASSLNLQRTVNQTGQGQSLTIHGSNSLSEKMQVNMKGSSSAIIIRNFN